MASSSRLLLGALLALLYLAQGCYCQYFKQFYNQRWGVTREQQGGVRRPSPPPLPPPASRATAAPNTDARTPVDLSAVFPPGRGYGRVYNPRWQGGSPGSSVVRETTLPTPVKAVSVAVTDSAVGTMPPEIASLLPPGMVLNPDGIPKSQLVVRTGDPDYTRFRQIFLRQMCQRMLNGPRAAEFGFCFQLLAF